MGTFRQNFFYRLAERMRDRDYMPSGFERTEIIDCLKCCGALNNLQHLPDNEIPTSKPYPLKRTK